MCSISTVGANGNGNAESQSSHLMPHHQRELEASGLQAETIRAAGIYSETRHEHLAALLGWRRGNRNLAPAIVFPFHGADGSNGYARVKPDQLTTIGGKPAKYLSPKGQPNQIYLPPGVIEVLQRPETELLITEGEKKSLKATQEGFACVGLVGVFGWKLGKSERLLPALEQIAWRGRSVFIAFDSDIARNELVQGAEARLAKHLTDLGATVRVVRLPDGPSDSNGRPTKMGLDDFIVAHGPGELRNLLDAAVLSDHAKGPECKAEAGQIDPGDEARAYLDTLKLDGMPSLRFWRGSWWSWSNGAYRERDLAELRADVIRYLDSRYRRLGSGIVSCVIDHLQSQAILATRTEPGSWLTEAPSGWQPNEILATLKQLVHLPSLVENQGNPIRPSTPRLFTTAALDFDLDLSAPQPEVWRNFLRALWGDDRQAISVLQQWFGYCLAPDTRQGKILLLIGPPRSGKGTIARVLSELVGRQNVAGPTLASMATNFGLSSLLGKSIAIVSDARLGRTDSAIVTERLLSISGEDALGIDRKFRETIVCNLPCRLMLLSNELPRLVDASGALANRFLVLRLTECFLGQEDHNLIHKLRAELPGILAWAIQGWQQLREHGRFVQADSGRELAGEMADLTSPIGVFVRERCALGAEFRVPRKSLYQAYRAWCSEKGREYVEDDLGFGRSLRALLTSLGDAQLRIDGERVRHYTGVGLQK